MLINATLQKLGRSFSISFDTTFTNRTLTEYSNPEKVVKDTRMITNFKGLNTKTLHNIQFNQKTCCKYSLASDTPIKKISHTA